ncbi:MAG: glycosyltransferase family 1 protein [Planctomycetes bacterium]|nr:glycosyltransferase family 1 protein [Planctomycetota bacterium]
MSAKARVRRIGLDVRAALRAPCGIGRVGVELARALADAAPEREILLYAASRHGRAWARPLPAELLARPNVRLFAPRLPAKALQWAARLPGVRTEWLTGRLDAFVHTDLVFVAGLRCPQIVMVHDLAFEVSRDFHDEGFHEAAATRLRRAVAHAAAIIVPSHATRADLIERWQIAPERITVIPLGGDHATRVAPGARRDPRADPTRPYALHVGTLEPRKNVVRLVRAWRAARSRGLELDLVLVGPWGWKTEALRAEIARAEMARDGAAAPVCVRGAVDEGELFAWLRDASLLCYPSLWEGFGLPIVEAFALGVPVLTSARSSTQEVAGDAALLVDPESEESITEALQRVGGDVALRADLAARGRARVAQFRWDSAARTLLRVIDSVGGG